MSESYTGNYAPNLFNENKRYYILQAQQQANLTDAELRDLHNISNTQNRRFIQSQIGDCAVNDGFLIAENPSDRSNNFFITGGSGLEDPGEFYLKGYRLFLTGDITYKDQTNTGSITDDGYTETALPALTTPSGTLNNLNDIDFLDPSIAACGDSSTIINTADYGINWADRNPSTSYDLNAISFGDTSTGYAAGNNGTVVKTEDGGDSWVDMISLTDNTHYYGVSFVNQNLGWIAGENGVIQRTTDGANWFPQASGTILDLNDIHAADSLNVWAVGNTGIVLNTPDAVNWAQQNSGVTQNLLGVFAVDATVVYAAGNAGTVIKTSNGGTAWSAQTSDTSENLNSLYFLNRFLGYAVGSDGVITVTDDGGTSWDSTTIADGTDLNGVSFTDTTGFVVGDGGLVLRTLDGTTWERYRTDYAYVDFHLAETSADATSGSEYIDTGIADALIGLPNANRLRVVDDMKVSEGWPVPSDYTTADGTVQHYTFPIAKIERTVAQPNIYESDITDLRPVVRTISELDSALKDGSIGTSSIADGAVTPDKLDSTGDYTMGSLNVLGDTTIGGDLKVEGILRVEDTRTSTITDNLTVLGSATFGDSTSLYDDTVGINGRIIHNHNYPETAYSLQVGATSDSSPVFNIVSDGTGAIFHIERSSDSSQCIIDSTNAGKGYDLCLWHGGYEGGILRARDDASNNTFDITKTAPGAKGNVFRIWTNSDDPAIDILNRSINESYSIRIDQTHGTLIDLITPDDATAISVSSSGAGDDIHIDHQGTMGNAIDVTSSSLEQAVRILNNAGTAIRIVQEADEALMVLNKDSTGQGRALEINNSGDDVGLGVYNTGTGIAQLISHVGDSTHPALDIFIAGVENGSGLRINKSNDETGEVIDIWNQGYGGSLFIRQDRTDSSAVSIRIDNTSMGMDISSANWWVDNSGNFFTHGDITTDATSTVHSARLSFDTSHFIQADSLWIDYTGFDSSNPAVPGQGYLESGFMRISDGTTPSPIPSWGATGATGPTGAQGETGAAGVGSTGATGLTGETGVQGIQGETGAGIQGETGVDGVQGETGIQGQTGAGIQGETGLQGITGLRGFTGLRGHTGVQGATGLLGGQGETGVRGLTGAGIQGETGVQGVQGQTGVIGETGVAGATGVQGVQGDTGSQGETGIAGETGVQGIQGDTGIQGETGVAGATGVQGETGVQGLQGDTGVAGETGVQGIQGETGTAGIDGVTGIQGETGVQGEEGDLGLQGETGIAGVDGVTGIQGETGVQGEEGDLGLQGETGIAGVDGVTGIQGETGIAGADGSTGIGTDGSTGVQGDTGIQGDQGDTGVAVSGGNFTQSMHKISSGEDTTGWFSLSPDPLNAQSVRLTAVGGFLQVNKQVVGATGETPDFDVLNTSEVHIKNDGTATGLSEVITTDDVLIIEYQAV